jgi:indoleamine 2,3-dioxygenase
MPELCDPYVYYRRVRPYIHGWKDHPLLPEGVIYRGVRELRELPQRWRGETGAQSGIVPALDAALGVVHAADPLRAYLAEMRDYMPPGHREFLAAVEAAPSIRAAVLASSDPDLRAAYDESLRWLEAFRSTHLDYAARYIHQQRPTGAANPTAVGTGGTPFMAYLRKHRDETARHRV